MPTWQMIQGWRQLALVRKMRQNVAIEIRALELALYGAPMLHTEGQSSIERCPYNDSEWTGWSIHYYNEHGVSNHEQLRSPRGVAQRAGWLAREIWRQLGTIPHGKFNVRS